MKKVQPRVHADKLLTLPNVSLVGVQACLCVSAWLVSVLANLESYPPF